MRYKNVCIEAFTHVMPPLVVTSEEIERRLEPVYRRLNLPPGRLEMMSGIKQRFLWSGNLRGGLRSVETVKLALEEAQLDVSCVGALINGSVCRDFMEPATACAIHHGVGLPSECVIYDVSNACLGILNGVIQIANMIELGQIKAGVVVGTEDSRSLLETTITRMNTDLELTRHSIKPLFASLTIGCASAAVVVTHKSISHSGIQLLGGKICANTVHCNLCKSDESVREGDFMQTDSGELLVQGVDTASTLFPLFLDELGWKRSDINCTFCHQVGKAHQKLLFESLEMSENVNFSTLEYMGNTGSVALPSAVSVGMKEGVCHSGDNIALLGVGSGINVMMLGIKKS